MKKIILGTLAAAVFMTMSASAFRAHAQEPNVEEIRMQENTTMVNPMSEYSKEEFGQKIGVYLEAPQGVSNVHYFLYTNQDGLLGEMQFTMQGKDYSQRVMATSKLSLHDMSEGDLETFTGVYGNWKNAKTNKVGYCEAFTLEENGQKTIVWLDVAPGIVYSVTTSDTSVTMNELVAIVNQLFVPVQG
ncbi:MAG: hypothetical protein Q4C49_09405 [Bacillota bacterium]|nr:hypothetical protein [Bacillota bacterium]